MSADDTKREMAETAELVRDSSILGSLMTFNVDYGFIEAIQRGFRLGILKASEYRQLVQCDNYDDVKLALGDTDFCQVLQSLNRLTPETILERCTAKFVDEFRYVQANASGPLASFLELMTYEYQIEAICFLISSLLKGADAESLLAKIPPLGQSPHLKSILAFDKIEGGEALVELYRTVLVDVPVGRYFSKYFSQELKGDQPGQNLHRVYNEVEIDVIKNMLTKLWLEDFYNFCEYLGGDTWATMKELLEWEADSRAISITINSFGTPLGDVQANRETDRRALYCSFGTLYPQITSIDGFCRKVDSIQALGQFLEPYQVFRSLWQEAQKAGGNDIKFIDELNDQMYRHTVQLNLRAFEGQSHLACFFAYSKLKRQEERNIKWILSCIEQKRGQEDFKRWIPIM